ncbi:MAG: molybdopterin-binding protein, partial [Myxococcota bacterium]
DANIPVLARTLRSLGISLDRVLMIPDDFELIAAEVRSMRAAFDLVFTSGGVGPTHDDLTIDAIAHAFACDVEVHPRLEAMLRGRYGDDVSEGHLRMARVPVGAKLVATEEMPWPATVMDNVWILPGVPQIFSMKMTLVRSSYGGLNPTFITVSLFTTMSEAGLKPHLDAVVEAFPEVSIGSYPKWSNPSYRTEVTFDARDPEVVDRASDALRSRLPADAVVDRSS